jgi:hypothetical protein
MEFLEVMVYVVAVVFALVVIFGIMYFRHTQIGIVGLEEIDVDRTESDALLSSSFHFEHPDKMTEVIGSYMGAQIYRFAAIHGVEYQFDHIFSPKGKMQEDKGACCLAPGLIYLPVPRPEE